MKISLERLPKSRVRLAIFVPRPTIQKTVDQAYEKLSQEMTIKGFRKGQAPKRMIFEAVGISRLRETIFQKLLPSTYFAAIQQEKIVPVEGPRVNIKSADWEKGLEEGKVGADLQYEAEVDVLPKVELTKDYKKIKVQSSKFKDVEVTDEEINSAIDHLRRQQAQFKEVERPAKEGDRVEIDFEGKVNQVIRPDFSSKNYPLILGSHTLLPEFEQNLLGMKKGQTKQFKVFLPAKTDPKKKEEIDFSVTMTDLKEVILPETTEDWAKKFGHDSLLALRGALRQGLRASKEERRRREIEQAIADQLIAAAKLEVPQSLIDQEIHRMIEALKAQVTQHHLPWEAYLTQLKKTEEDLHRDLSDQAAKTVKFGLILGHIMTKEGIDSKQVDAGRRVMDRLISYATNSTNQH